MHIKLAENLINHSTRTNKQQHSKSLATAKQSTNNHLNTFNGIATTQNNLIAE